ncbi:MAG: right-handed parallel beta-helix repeat-containing protein [Anaerolineae bacterium]
MQSGSRLGEVTRALRAGTENWYGHGVYSYGSALTATGNTFTGNATTAVYVNGGSSPTIANNTFTGNAGYAVNLKAPCSPASGSNNASGNTINGIGLGGSTIGGNTTLPYSNLPYVGPFTVAQGAILTIPAGQVFVDDSALVDGSPSRAPCLAKAVPPTTSSQSQGRRRR